MDFFTSTKGFGGLAGLAQQMASQVEKSIDKVLEIEDANHGATTAITTAAPPPAAAMMAEEPRGEPAEDQAEAGKKSLSSCK